MPLKLTGQGKTVTRLYVLTLVAVVAITAASPAARAEIETIYQLDVTVPDRDALQALVNAGFDIGSVHGDIATVYATERERDALKAAMFSFVEVGRQPNPPKAGRCLSHLRRADVRT